MMAKYNKGPYLTFTACSLPLKCIIESSAWFSLFPATQKKKKKVVACSLFLSNALLKVVYGFLY